MLLFYLIYGSMFDFVFGYVCQAGQTPLHVATIHRHDIIISDLLEAGADVDARDPNGYTALMLACLKDYADITSLLLEYDASIDIRDNEGL